MKLLKLILIVLIAVSCEKENKCSGRSCVTVEVKDKHTNEYLPCFTYEINSNGIGGVNNHLVKTGKIKDGFISFPYTTEKGRWNEISVESDSLKGYFWDHQNFGYITDDSREFEFYFVTYENIKIVATNTNCFNDNDKLSVRVKNLDSPNSDTKYISKTGCLEDAVIFDKPLSSSSYEISWTVTRDNGIVNGSTIVELGETEDETVIINY